MVIEGKGKNMKVERLAGIALIITGGSLLIYGAVNANQSLINLGLAGIFLGVVILTFKSHEYVKREALDSLTLPYVKALQKIVNDLGLEGKALYIPPYENLKEGGVFIPLHEEFDLDLGRLDDETVFLTNVSSERQMGLSIRPLGLDLLRKYEEHLEYSLENSNYKEVESVSSSVLRALDLANTVYIEEENNSFRIIVSPTNKEICRKNIEHCDQVACPICSSILLGLAKASNEVVMSEKFSFVKHGIEIKARKLGGIREWM
ncbi:hypothetical protein [Thermococcus barophilus]|uniref:DUF7982 domain-containing protein n=1 Tax=Thermococcus barophilus (strain DSM 11836 / MP) TaxID=391623 RepID=F0LLZ1_THEBM|nr:hypothetical protein [Thermococcus barophilus]ADT85090.1 hypothetical protein TERMP_02116 [Thermococcus barophilus MP]